MYLFCMILLIFFAIIGLSAFINTIINAAHNSIDDEILLIIGNLNENNAEARIRKAARICMNTKGAQIICVCDDKNPAYSICEIMKREYPFIEIKNTDEANELFT